MRPVKDRSATAGFVLDALFYHDYRNCKMNFRANPHFFGKSFLISLFLIALYEAIVPPILF
jgi:hypothetical protein